MLSALNLPRANFISSTNSFRTTSVNFKMFLPSKLSQLLAPVSKSTYNSSQVNQVNFFFTSSRAEGRSGERLNFIFHQLIRSDACRGRGRGTLRLIKSGQSSQTWREGLGRAKEWMYPLHLIGSCGDLGVLHFIRFLPPPRFHADGKKLNKINFIFLSSLLKRQ